MYQSGFDWDDARIFLWVAREGSLRAAGRALRLSQPTVGRRLARFEAALGTVPLFDRLPDGVRLTAAGSAILPLVEKLEDAAHTLQRQHRLANTPDSVPVRLSVGEWAGGFLAQCLEGSGAQARLPEGALIELVVSDQTANLSRREADLAVRHGRPETGDLYVARVGSIACGVYSVDPHCGNRWISFTEEQAHYAVSRWIDARAHVEGNSLRTRASNLGLQLAAARAGSGRVVLPCYVGDAEAGLVRVGGPIAELDAPHWLIVHRDLRRLPHIRAVMNWVAGVFAANRLRLAGETAPDEDVAIDVNQPCPSAGDSQRNG